MNRIQMIMEIMWSGALILVGTASFLAAFYLSAVLFLGLDKII